MLEYYGGQSDFEESVMKWSQQHTHTHTKYANKKHNQTVNSLLWELVWEKENR